MRRVLNFSLGFMVGVVISTMIVLLVTPQSAKAIRQLFKEAYTQKKAELEKELNLMQADR